LTIKPILIGTTVLVVLYVFFTIVPLGFLGGFIIAGIIGGIIAGVNSCGPGKGLLSGFISAFLASLVYFALVAVPLLVIGSPIIGVAAGSVVAGIAFSLSVVASSVMGFIGGFAGKARCMKNYKK